MTCQEIYPAPDEEGMRLDKFLSEKLNFSRNRVQKFIKEGAVLVNGFKKNKKYSVSQGDKILCDSLSRKEKTAVLDADICYIHKEDTFVVVDKPYGIVVHPAPGLDEYTLYDILKEKYRYVQTVHRLDRNTSGVIIVAVDRKAARNLKSQFKQGKVKKTYLAIVGGRVKADAGELDLPLKRSNKNPTKMEVSWVKSRSSVTRFRVVDRVSDFSLLELYPLSGRTHQIRVHLSYSGHPVLGDDKYGGGYAGYACRHLLHAWRISFFHPEKKGRVNYCSAPPPDFIKKIRKLGFENVDYI